MGQVKPRRIKPPRIVHEPRRGIAIAITIALVFFGLIGWVYLAALSGRELTTLTAPDQAPADKAPGTAVAVSTAVEQNPHSIALEQRSDSLARNRGQLEVRIADLVKERDALSVAAREAQEEIRRLQAETASLRSQIELIGQLFGDNGTVEIGDLVLSPVNEHSVGYWFKVSRQDAGAGRDMLTGQVRLQLRGKQDGEIIYLGLEELTGGARGEHKLGFRQFQEIDGVMELPAGFEPEELLVLAMFDDAAIGGVRRQFLWRLDGTGAP